MKRFFFDTHAWASFGAHLFNKEVNKDANKESESGEQDTPKTIVKVQLPIESTVESIVAGEEGDPALVYNEDRSAEFFLKVTWDLLDVMDGELSAFFEVDIDDGGCDMLRRVEDQGW